MDTPQTLLWKIEDGLVLLVHGSVPPSARDWDAYLDELVKATSHGSTVLVVTDGPGPNAAQRSAMTERLAERGLRDIRTAVVTASAVARGIVGVIAWFNPSIRPFAPAEIVAALRYLDVAPARQPEVLGAVAALRAQVSGAPVADAASATELLRATAVLPMEAVVERLAKLRGRLERKTAR